MIKVKLEDLVKAVKFLEQESLSGLINVKENGAELKLSSTDKSNREIVIELSDTSYPFYPRVTKTERL
jgi:hypothetical protein